MKEYNLTMDEVQLIVLGSLYNALATEDACVITTLDVKNYLRKVRKATITQAKVSKALDDFYKWWKEDDEFVLEVNDKSYALNRKSNGIYLEYYLEEVEVEEDEDIDAEDEDIDAEDEDLLSIIKRNMDKSSYQIQQILRDMGNISLPSIRSIAAYKANITRRINVK